MIRYLMCILLLLSVVISGCGKTDKITETAAETQNYTVHDIRGKKITFAKKPERIASSFVYADEILLDLVDHQKIVGLSKWVHDPGLSMGHKQAEDVPGIVENNLESVIALKPDLFFIADTAKKEYIDSLEDAGIKVYVFKYISRLDEIPDLVKGIGEAVGEKEKAETLIKKGWYTMGVCKKIKRKDDQERNVWENISEKKEGRVLERTRQSMKRKISNDL